MSRLTIGKLLGMMLLARVYNAMPFERWLSLPGRRQRYIYHTGLLVADRQHDPYVDIHAKLAWKAYLEGKVILVQQRSYQDPYKFDYFAVKVR